MLDKIGKHLFEDIRVSLQSNNGGMFERASRVLLPFHSSLVQITKVDALHLSDLELRGQWRT